MVVAPISSQPSKAPLSPLPPNHSFFKETKAFELKPVVKLSLKLSSTVPPCRSISPKPVLIVTLSPDTVKAWSEA